MTPQKNETGFLSLKNVSKNFEQGSNIVKAVDDISLDIVGGEFITLLGPSGCGKTTTLRLIAGFETLTTGMLNLDGKDISHQLPNERSMAMVFQSYALFPHLNVFENVAYGLRLKHMRESEIKETVSLVMHMMNLVGLEKRSPGQLSGGQQQRVALARAMVMKPKVLLFDEPLSNLDAKLRTQMRLEIRHLQQQLGITSVYVTHDQVEAMSLSDRIVVMNRGKIEQVARPEEIFLRPASLFVADFIGRANFIETQVKGRMDATCQINAFGMDYWVVCDPSIKVGDKVYLMARPEAVKVHDFHGDKTAEIVSTIYLGSTVEYELEVHGFNLVAVDASPKFDQLFREGKKVGLYIDPDRCFVLPYDGNR
jgi:iron(III) transport system ATP-binding protein